MFVELSHEEVATIRAAMRVYRDHGCGEPSERTVDVHEIATACGDVISLDDEGIETLDVRLCKVVNATQPLTSAVAEQADNPHSALAVRIEAAEKEAGRSCGCSDVLFEKRVHEAYEKLLECASASERPAMEEALKERGFDPDWTPYVSKEGECELTGIETGCCPCGRHE